MKEYTYIVNKKSILLDNQESYLLVEPVTADIFHISFSKKAIKRYPSLLIEQEKIQNAHPITFQVIQQQNGNNTELEISTEKVKAVINLENGRICWRTKEDNRLLLQEAGRELTAKEVSKYTTGNEKPIINRVRTVDGERNFIQNLKEIKDREAYRGKLCFSFREEEGIYGLGQAEEGIYNYRHHNQYLYQHNMRIPMPMFYSDAGYGILMDCSSLMTFEDNENGSYLFLDTIEQMDYYFIAGKKPDQVIHGFRYLTGQAAMLPKWAFGYIQSKEQYYTAKELLDIVEQYRLRKVPIDCVVQDWNTWEPGNWGEKLLDKKRYGDLKECMDKIHEMHAHSMVSVWPNMNTGGKNHTEFFENGFLLNDYSTYNAFDENARKMYWKQASEELFAGGFDAWWCDSTEPFSGPDWGGEIKREPWERFQLVGGEHKKYLDPAVANAFALMHAKGIFENQRTETENMRVLNLTRSGYASGQKYAAMLWSGDTYASWETLRKQIIEGLNMGISGYPYWTLDIGGFFVVGEKWQNRGCGCNLDSTPKWFWRGKYDEGVADAGYCELYTRWLEFGTFLPMFRSHGTDTPREIWNFGQKGTPFYDAIDKFIHLRYQLMPYIYSMAGAVRNQNATIMRSLLFDYSDDMEARKIQDEFLFGTNLLICPVIKPMFYDAGNVKLELPEEEKGRSCYLPIGTKWIDFWTGEICEGGQYVYRYTPIDQIPIFIKAGSIIPMAEGLQYAEQKPEMPIKLYIYPGSDASFLLYEDEGNNYHYEQGGYSEIPFEWYEQEKVFTIGTRKGNYPGMERQREFIICVGDMEHKLFYSGEKISYSFHDIPQD